MQKKKCGLGLWPLGCLRNPPVSVGLLSREWRTWSRLQAASSQALWGGHRGCTGRTLGENLSIRCSKYLISQLTLQRSFFRDIYFSFTYWEACILAACSTSSLSSDLSIKCAPWKFRSSGFPSYWCCSVSRPLQVGNRWCGGEMLSHIFKCNINSCQI